MPEPAAFNSDVYVAAATVIPVLVIALMFPGGLLHRYALWAKRWRSRHLAPAMSRDLARKMAEAKPTKRLVSGNQHWARSNIYMLLMVPVDLVVIAGLLGEICAVIALDRQHATAFEHFWVLKSLYVLPAVAGLSAILAISQAHVKWLTEEQRAPEAIEPDPE